MIHVEKLNEVFLHVYADDMGIEAELSEFFAYYAEGFRFMPKYKAKVWDGRIKLWNDLRKTLYVGLYPYLVQFAEKRGYSINNINEIEPQKVDLRDELYQYTDSLCIHSKGTKITAHDYQLDAIIYALTCKRAMLISPTASGKSLIIYAICRWLIEQNKKILVIVPSTSLVEQMYSDFEDYSSHNGWSTTNNCQKIYFGFPKTINSNITFSTWQSIHQLPAAWFAQFDCIIGDEAHQFKAQSLISIMEKLTNIQYRIGTTGSLSDSKVNTLVLEGLFGKIKNVTTTNELQESGKLSKLLITSIILKHDDESCKMCKDLEYKDEVQFLIGHSKRNNFISNLAVKSSGNTLVLFQMVEKHGIPLYDLIKNKTDRPVYFIHGQTKTDERERIRHEVSTQNNAIIVASFGVYSTGVNVPSIENIIFASPTKSRIRNLQSIGRGLRLNKGKTHCNLYDLTDNLQWKSHKNHVLKHGAERYKLYVEQKFPVKIVEVKL